MKSFDEFYWKHNDCLNKDTSLEHSFGEKVWLHKQQEVDELKKRIEDALKVLNDASPTMLDKKAIRILKGENHES